MNDNDIVWAIIFVTLIVLLLVAGIAISAFIINRQKLQQAVTITQIELNYEKELRQVETEVSEQMMERFAQELHDNLGHILTCMRLQVENKKLDFPQLEFAFLPIEDSIEEASEHMRLLSRSLNTDYILNIGLENAIGIELNRIRQLRKHEIHFVKGSEPPALDKNQELMVFRIFQEMLHNTIRHSKAKNIYIALHTTDTQLLQVRDDGKGFPLSETMHSEKASGLKNMIKRAQLAQMECKIVSAPGEGCCYTINSIPLQNQLFTTHN